MKAQDYQISSEKFVFRSTDEKIHDKKFETKPVTYFQDALRRFAKNKASIVAAAIIALLLLFAIIAPILSPYTVSYEDRNYKYAIPRNELCVKLGLNFWDGGKTTQVNEETFFTYQAIEQETGKKVILSDPEDIVITEEIYFGKTKKLYTFRSDTYADVGVVFYDLTAEQYEALQKYQDENNVQIILPAIDSSKSAVADQDENNANLWYQTKIGKGRKTEIVYDADGNMVPAYKEADGTDGYTSKMYWEGEEKLYNYAIANQTGYRVRVDYSEYYTYLHDIAGDGITKASHLFGADEYGRDIFTRLASGARFSFILAIIVASVNLFIGAIYGSIEGYYGGKIDLVMERIVDLLASIPFMIVITLLKYHFNVSHIIILFISFFLTGWTGMAGRTRMQFYRFKNQEYVLVARTLGAKDSRIMFKHIFPNAIGTLITSSVLVIPGVIFSETSLSYLGIINLNSGSLTSVGTLLSTGQNYLFTFPHMIVPPAIFISLLMLSFNLFGNGLRDAFNPSLRGTED